MDLRKFILNSISLFSYTNLLDYFPYKEYRFKSCIYMLQQQQIKTGSLKLTAYKYLKRIINFQHKGTESQIQILAFVKACTKIQKQ